MSPAGTPEGKRTDVSQDAFGSSKLDASDKLGLAHFHCIKNAAGQGITAALQGLYRDSRGAFQGLNRENLIWGLPGSWGPFVCQI